jgi:predicted dienelactone hydrolase
LPVRFVLVAALAVAAHLAAPAFAERVSEVETRIGGVAVTLWSPLPLEAIARDVAPMPVVVFSHGMYMCPTQARFLMAALATRGYLVIAPRHADSNCQYSFFPELSRLGFKPSPFWTEYDFRDRAEDIRRVVATLPIDPRFRTRADFNRVGLAGHSLGGYTVLGLGGAWPSWRLSSVGAILALSPYTLPFQRDAGLRGLGAPVMYQIGTLDPVFSLPIGSSGFAFEQSPAPKYLVEIDGAAHMAWTDFGTTHREAIVDYAVAFFERYLRGRGGETLETRLPGVSTLLVAERAAAN